MTAPTVRFTDERLANGLRLIVAEDHLASSRDLDFRERFVEARKSTHATT